VLVFTRLNFTEIAVWDSVPRISRRVPAAQQKREDEIGGFGGFCECRFRLAQKRACRKQIDFENALCQTGNLHFVTAVKKLIPTASQNRFQP
jgi:hypothetical protein